MKWFVASALLISATVRAQQADTLVTHLAQSVARVVKAARDSVGCVTPVQLRACTRLDSLLVALAPPKPDTIGVPPADLSRDAINRFLVFAVNPHLSIGQSSALCVAYSTPSGLHGLLFATPQPAGPVDTTLVPYYSRCHAIAGAALTLNGADFFTHSDDPNVGLQFPAHGYRNGTTPPAADLAGAPRQLPPGLLNRLRARRAVRQ